MSKILSICIPTYGRVEILKETLKSFYATDLDSDLYEICISDNSPTDETKEMLELNFADKKNLVYRKSTCEGYYNSIEALKLGSGKFLKLHNNYTKVKNNFSSFFETINQCSDSDSVIFFTFGAIKANNEIRTYSTFNSFMYCISYFSTWSTSFGIWKSDFVRLMNENIQLDKMFPHTSLLFALTDKSKYIVDDSEYFINQDVGKKGGYNLPETFGTRYLGMCKALLEKGSISEKTYKKIKKGILRFISIWLYKARCYPEKYTFAFDNWKTTISSLYGACAVFRVEMTCLVRYVTEKFRLIKK